MTELDFGAIKAAINKKAQNYKLWWDTLTEDEKQLERDRISAEQQHIQDNWLGMLETKA